MRTKSMVVSVLVVGLLAGPAFAEGDKRRVATSKTKQGYAYEFDDDALDAIPQGARGARIRVRPMGKRTLLIRPRTHFINELFKSAENL
jgi:hypothetical protein